jgi:hypothetical protein
VKNLVDLVSVSLAKKQVILPGQDSDDISLDCIDDVNENDASNALIYAASEDNDTKDEYDIAGWVEEKLKFAAKGLRMNFA